MLRTDGAEAVGAHRTRNRSQPPDRPDRPGAPVGAHADRGDQRGGDRNGGARKAAFAAALEGIDRIKRVVPIWKKEHFADGEVWVEGEWDRNATLAAKRLARRVLLAAALSAQIKVNVNLVRVLATVKNPAGQLVGALNKEDFEILDNGVPQQIAVFERQTEQPLSVAMMVDAAGLPPRI